MDERLQPLLITVLVVGLGVALAAALRQSAHPLPDARAIAGNAVARFETVRVVGRAEGRRAWVLTAPTVTMPQGRDRLEFVGGIEATLYRDDQPRAVCTAPTARYESASQRLQADGGVAIRLLPPRQARDGDLPPALGEITLRMSSITWTAGDRTLVCEKPVAATFRNGEARVQSLRLNLETRTLDTKVFQGRFLVKDLNL